MKPIKPFAKLLSSGSAVRLLPAIEHYVEGLPADWSSVADHRLSVLESLASFVVGQIKEDRKPLLVFACVHNARRSIFGQVWSQVAACLHDVRQFSSYSAGAEATYVHPETIAALQRAGLLITKTVEAANPIYNAIFSRHAPALLLYSKAAKTASLPKGRFGVVLVCEPDTAQCPYIPQAFKQFHLPYDDPGQADNTDLCATTYDRICRQVAAEMMWLFYFVRQQMR